MRGSRGCGGLSVDGSAVFKKRLSIPQPAQRLVFIDEGLASPDAYAVRYTQVMWWDQPVTRHGDGTNFGYADGHADCFKWKGGETVKQGRKNVRTWQGNFSPQTSEGVGDVVWMQQGIWGKPVYKPNM